MRALGSHIKGTNGKSQGVVPFLKVVNDTAVAVNQGGKRKGAVCAYLETWHLDIEEFLELRKNTGDDRRRTHDMNTANWIPDLFMKRVMEDGDWTLFSPVRRARPARHVRQAPSRRPTPRYEDKAARGEIKLFKKMPARRPVAQDAVDAVRDRASVDHVQGRRATCARRSSTSASCTLEPVHRDHAEHQRRRDRGLQPRLGQPGRAPRRDGELDHDKLQDDRSRTAMRMLDNVIDINYYAVDEGAQLEPAPPPGRPRHHGLPGLPAPAAHAVRVARRRSSSPTARWKRSATTRYWASTELAEERGRYSTYRGLAVGPRHPAAGHARAAAPRSAAATSKSTTSSTLDWDALRARITQHGMRNSNCVAIAPTATISNIIGVVASIEPTTRTCT